MSILNDKQIAKLAIEEEMISPFVSQHEMGVISYGLSSFGYDIRCAGEWWVFHNSNDGLVLDPKNFLLTSYRYSQTNSPSKSDPSGFVTHKGKSLVLEPGQFALSKSVEYVKIPQNVFAIAVGKSTYARCGVDVLVTPIEPGWEGEITLEITNLSSRPVTIYGNEGIVQLVFFKGERPARTYSDKNGKYQGQTGITPGKVVSALPPQQNDN